MRRTPLQEPLGLSAVDLISCAFIAVMILNLLVSESDQEERTGVPPDGNIIALTPLIQAPVSLGMLLELPDEDKIVRSWEATPGFDWDTTGAELMCRTAEPLPGNVEFHVILLDDRSQPELNSTIPALLTWDAKEKLITLTAENSFYEKASLP